MQSLERSGFTGEMWAAAEPTYDAILKHPFLEGLASGELDPQAFRFYVVEDAYYLTEFARAISITAAKAPKDEWIVRLNRDAIGSLEAERALHESYFKDFGLSVEEVESRRPAPTTLAYTSYLISATYSGSFAEALASILPCYWIYLEVGKELAKKGSPKPMYQRWIDNYGSDSYEAEVRSILDMMDEVAEGEGSSSRKTMTEHFTTTSRYEWMFWDMGYRQEAWPVV